MIRPVAALHGADAQIFDLLAHVVAIVENRKIGGRADVWRVADEHLRVGHREPTNEQLRRRCDSAERRAREYREQLDHARRELAILRETEALRPTPPVSRRTVALLPRWVELVEGVARGRQVKDLAPEIGMTPSSASNVLSRVVREAGATNTRHLLAMVASGEVELRVRAPRRAA